MNCSDEFDDIFVYSVVCKFFIAHIHDPKVIPRSSSSNSVSKFTKSKLPVLVWEYSLLNVLESKYIAETKREEDSFMSLTSTESGIFLF